MLTRLIAPLLFTCACSNSFATKSSFHEEFNAANSPVRMRPPGIAMQEHLTELPTSASLPAWISADIYHFSENGTAKRTGDELSPIEKYDAAFNPGLGNPATKWERIHHGKEGGSLESWYGHCHSVAASVAVEEEPSQSVTLHGITFSPQDVKALLAEAYFLPQEKVAGKRCELSATPTNSQGRVVEEDCRDLNPGTFHVTLANYVGLFHLKPILDIDATYKVWSATVRAFHSEITAITLTEASKLAGNNGTTFSGNSASFQKVRTKIFAMLRGEIVREYEYILEVNVQGKIIGGEWIGESRKNHPDFMWFPAAPGAQNPYVNVKNILALARYPYKE
jgi:hypothetical protein